MSKSKAPPLPPSPAPAKSRGTIMAEETRAKANELSDAERQDLMADAMQLIYRGKDRGRVAAHRR